MKIVDRYIAGNLIRGYLPILLVFLSVFSLIVMVDEVDEVGRGRYTFWKATEYLILTLPSRFVLLAPFVALLGSVMALGALANGRELIAMQAAGISPLQMAGSVMKVGMVFMIIVAGVQEFVSPPLDQQAMILRSVALSKSKAYQGKQGLWFREGSRFIRVKKVVYGEVPKGIDIFEFNDQGQMTLFLHAQEADVGDPQRWLLKRVEKKLIAGQKVAREYLETLPWDSPLKQDEMRLLTLPTSSLSPSDLYHYIEVLQRKKQNSLRYELAFWDKVFMPLTTGLMVLIAFPFVFGPLRNATVGKRMLLGALAGIGYYLFTEVLEQFGLLVGISPLFTTALPFGCLGILTLIFWWMSFS